MLRHDRLRRCLKLPPAAGPIGRFGGAGPVQMKQSPPHLKSGGSARGAQWLDRAPRLPMPVQKVVHMNAVQQQGGTGFELRFDPLAGTGQALVFPCDANGQVDMNALSSRALCDYLFARALIGR